MTPPRKKYIFHVARTSDSKFKCPRCHYCFSKYDKLKKHVQKIHITSIRGLSLQRQAPCEKNRDSISFEAKMCNELDDLARKLKSAEERYLPLLERGLPISNDFCRCFNSIIELKQSFKGFIQRQNNQTEHILYGKVVNEKDRVTTIIKNLREEVKKLNIEIINNNKTIALLNKKCEEYDKLKKDHEALLNNNDNYYVDRCRSLQRENYILKKRNLELNEEIEDHTRLQQNNVERNRKLELENGSLIQQISILNQENFNLHEEINRLKKRNGSLLASLSGIVINLDDDDE
ncbi:7470_t:CDS:2 [Dentiscutata heterogama]|uniref:7470_t:CDS:1 n=1 Tax=Dentiscutata heterogama TaxID=1316150 RepID=A0ACA9NE89_9GLOM|nr:7470_t:CDS:2 [Dentiscutata heterogama]